MKNKTELRKVEQKEKKKKKYSASLNDFIKLKEELK